MSGLPRPNICVRCFKPSSSFCTLCKSVYYCSKPCQKKDWELGHKIKCKEIRAAAAKATEENTLDASSGPSSSPTLVSSSSEDGPTFSSVELSKPTRWLFAPPRITPLFTTQPIYPPSPVGFLNPKKANSCFYNVILQTLTYTKPFINLLDSMDHKEAECKLSTTNKFCMICALIKLRAQILQNSRESGGIITPKPILPVQLLSNLSQLSSDYQLGQQEDSHDTMKNLLHNFDEAWKKNEPSLLPHAPVEGQLPQPVKSLSHRTLETTPISQLFGGYLLSEIKCAACSKFTSRFEFYLDLSLEIIEATDELGDMLEAFSRPEKLDQQNQYKCSHCSKLSRARKQITIYQPSNIMMIQLKRFRMGMFGKVNKYIKFPVELSLRKYMSGCKLKEEEEFMKQNNVTISDLSTVYRLYAVIVHLDLLNVSSFGHYICFIRDVNSSKPEDWLKYDDDTITKVTQKDVLKQNAYILFYQRSTPFVSEEVISTEPEVDASVSSPTPDPSSSASPTADSTTAPAPASDAPVQCIGGCGFFGRAATNNMCSQCFKKYQIEQGIIPKESPPPPSSTSRASSQQAQTIDPMMLAAMMRMRMAQQQQQGHGEEEDDTDNLMNLRVMAQMAQLQQQRQQQQAEHMQMQKLAMMHRAQAEAAASQQLQPTEPAPTTTTNPSSTTHHAGTKVGRNDKCPCGSGRKFKACHGADKSKE